MLAMLMNSRQCFFIPGYANRSATLFRGDKFSSCIADIQAALFYSDQVIEKILVFDFLTSSCSYLFHHRLAFRLIFHFISFHFRENLV